MRCFMQFLGQFVSIRWSFAHAYRNSSCAKWLFVFLIAAGDGVAAIPAMAIIGELVAENFEPVTDDHRLPAAGAEGSVAFLVVYVARVHVVEASIEGEAAGA